MTVRNTAAGAQVCRRMRAAADLYAAETPDFFGIAEQKYAADNGRQ